MKSPFSEPNKKKFSWGGTITFLIGLMIWQMCQQQEREKFNEEMAQSYRKQHEQQEQIDASLHPKIPALLPISHPANIDSIISEINKEKKKHHIVVAGFDKQDSCIMLFRDYSPIDTTTLIKEFSDLCNKYKIDVASNITSLIVFKMPLPSQKNKSDLDYETLFISAKPGSKIYNSYDSMGVFKH